MQDNCSHPGLVSCPEPIISGGPSPAMGRLLQRIVMAQGLLLLAAGSLVPSANLPLSKIRLERSGILALGAVVFVASLSRRTPPKFNLLLIAILGVAESGFAIGYRAPRVGDSTFGITRATGRVLQKDDGWIEGKLYAAKTYQLRKNASARQFCKDFDVNYHTDADGWRSMPTPRSAGRPDEVWFFGCSYTFGVGVEDNQTYPFLLASRAWPELRVRNFGVAGYGTTNVYLNLRDQFSRGQKPRAVLYGWIRFHPSRNYLRRSNFINSVSLIPKFEVKNGRLVDFGMVPRGEATLVEGPDLAASEFQITVALIQEMARMCRARGVPFVVLVLDEMNERTTAALLGEPGLDILDVGHVSNSYFVNDMHPNSIWHGAVASAIASHPLLADRTGDSRLLAPAAFPKSPVKVEEGWKVVNVPEATLAGLSVSPKYRERLLMKMRACPPESKVLQIQMKTVSLKKGHEYQFEAEMRSDWRKSVDFAVLQDHEPYEDLAKEEVNLLTPQWRTFRKKFTSHLSESTAQLLMFASGSGTHVQVRNTVIREDGRVIDHPREALHLRPNEPGEGNLPR
jgi:hypothetical protein